jgi:hypothetical protein
MTEPREPPSEIVTSRHLWYDVAGDRVWFKCEPRHIYIGTLQDIEVLIPPELVLELLRIRRTCRKLGLIGRGM